METPLPEEALICAFRIPPTGPALPVAAAEIPAVLEHPGAVTWLHFRLADARAERFLMDSGLFPAALRNRLVDHDSHTTLEAVEGGLTVVLTDLSFGHTDDTQAASLWGHATARSFVSARKHALHSVDALRHAVRNGLNVASGVELVATLFELRNQTLRGITLQLTDDVNEIEDEILRGDIQEQRERLGRVRRRCAQIRRHFMPDRGALQKLLARPPAWLEPADGERLRAESEELAHLIDDANELYERSKLLQEELAARLAEKTGDRLYVLSVLSAVLLPMTLISGVFGMNVGGLPGVQHDGAFFWTMLLMLGAGVLTIGLLRWKKLL